LCSVLKDTKLPEPTKVRSSIIAVVADSSTHADNRVASLSLVQCLGLDVPVATKDTVDKAVKKPPDLSGREDVQQHLFRLGTSGAVDALRARIRSNPEYVGALTNFGAAGRSAEPDAIALLTHDQPTVRLAATWALGVIGSSRAVEPLRRALLDPRDWRLTCAAARSLAQLAAGATLPDLEQLAVSHWYPPVRDCAKAAADAVRRKRPAEAQAKKWFVPDGADWREKAPLAAAEEPRQLSSSELAVLSVGGEVESSGPDGRHVAPVQTTPTSGLKYRGAMLLGTDRGEWGGELVWTGAAKPATLLTANIKSLHELGDIPVVVTGLGHMGINEGALYRVTAQELAPPRAELWRVLPGEPERSYLLHTGALFVSCRGGDVVVMPDGTMWLAADYLAKHPRAR
jgi:hypothetical protein